MGEGERLRLLLEAARYDQVELAEACGVTKNAVHKWTRQQGKFSRSVWEKVSLGLRALNLDPGQIRPEPKQLEVSEDLTRLVENWPRAQLATLKRVLESSDASRAILLAYINGSLRDIP